MTAVTPDDKPVKSKDQPKGPVGELFELGKTIFYALAIALVLRIVLFQPFTIPSASMEPTLLEGDYIIVSKFSYGWSRHSIPFSPKLFEGRFMGKEPARGDVVVFRLPRDTKVDYIKRVVGLPGDRVQMLDGQLQINGKPVPHTAMSPVELQAAFGSIRTVDRFKETLPNGRSYVTYSFGESEEVDNTPVYTVPAGQYFMMGDNRDNSLDSRYPTETGVGFVPAENLVGRAEVILFSWSPDAALFKPWTWFTEARLSRFGQRLH